MNAMSVGKVTSLDGTYCLFLDSGQGDSSMKHAGRFLLCGLLSWHAPWQMKDVLCDWERTEARIKDFLTVMERVVPLPWGLV